MKIVAAVFADFVTAPAGGPSQLQSPLQGQSILAHTLRRLMRVEGLAQRCLYVRPRDAAPAAEALRAAGVAEQVELRANDSAGRPRRALLTTARKWSLESWRGGLLGATVFDEFAEPLAVAQVLDHFGSDAVLCIDGHSPVLDPVIATAMIAHANATHDEARLTFTQAPPGLAGVILGRDALRDLLELTIPVGLLLSYRPELAQTDPIIHSSCMHVDPQIAHTAARLTGDTRRSRELLASAFDKLGTDAAALDLCRWLGEPSHCRAGPLPVEVELELTTADPLPHTTLRPRGARVPSRELSDLGAVERLAAELAQYDDRLVVLGGHGDPLQHPRFSEVCRLLRAAGVYGLAVVTPLVDLTDETFTALFEHEIDVVEVQIDAHSAATYEQVHGVDRLGLVHGNIERIEQARRERVVARPIVAPSLARCGATIGDMEAFFDEWIRKLGSAVIQGYTGYCGALPDDTLLSTTSPIREPCRRLGSRMMLHADGAAPLCAQDFRGKQPVGDWRGQSLAEIWGGDALEAVRGRHRSLELETLPKCRICTEWGRP